MVSNLNPPVQNLINISLNAAISVEGSEVMAFFNISYDQLVGPNLILFGVFLMAEYRVRSEGMYTFLGVVGGLLSELQQRKQDAHPAIAGVFPECPVQG